MESPRRERGPPALDCKRKDVPPNSSERWGAVGEATAARRGGWRTMCSAGSPRQARPDGRSNRDRETFRGGYAFFAVDLIEICQHLLAQMGQNVPRRADFSEFRGEC